MDKQVKIVYIERDIAMAEFHKERLKVLYLKIKLWFIRRFYE